MGKYIIILVILFFLHPEFMNSMDVEKSPKMSKEEARYEKWLQSKKKQGPSAIKKNLSNELDSQKTTSQSSNFNQQQSRHDQSHHNQSRQNQPQHVTTRYNQTSSFSINNNDNNNLNNDGRGFSFNYGQNVNQPHPPPPPMRNSNNNNVNIYSNNNQAQSIFNTFGNNQQNVGFGFTSNPNPQCHDGSKNKNKQKYDFSKETGLSNQPLPNAFGNNQPQSAPPIFASPPITNTSLLSNAPNQGKYDAYSHHTPYIHSHKHIINIT